MQPDLSESCIEILKEVLISVYISASEPCQGDYVRCGGQSPSRRCVHPIEICNGNDECGNGWDEEPATCGEFSKLTRSVFSSVMYKLEAIQRWLVTCRGLDG